MSIIDTMFSLLNVASVTAQVAANDILPPGNWQNLGSKYIIHCPVSEDPTDTHAGQATNRHWPFYQVGIFASTVGECQTIAELVRVALHGNHAGIAVFYRGGGYVGRDPDVDREQWVQNYEVWGAL